MKAYGRDNTVNGDDDFNIFNIATNKDGKMMIIMLLIRTVFTVKLLKDAVYVCMYFLWLTICFLHRSAYNTVMNITMCNTVNHHPHHHFYDNYF